MLTGISRDKRRHTGSLCAVAVPSFLNGWAEITPGEDLRFRMMRIARVTPKISQRDLACRIGIGFGGALWS